MDDDDNQASSEWLAGKTIEQVWLKDDEESLGFSCSDGTWVQWDVSGDCCSNSWFADIVGTQTLFGGTVREVQTVMMDEIGYNVADGRERDHDEAYGYKIITDLGWCDVVFRNSSNGYYGGWMSSSRCSPPTPDDLAESWAPILNDHGATIECSENIVHWQAERERIALEHELRARQNESKTFGMSPGKFRSI